MKEYIRKHSTLMIVSLISFMSLVVSLMFLPLIFSLPATSSIWVIGLSIAIPAVLVSAIVSTPVVYYYKRIIEENHEIIERLGKDPLTQLLNRHTFFDVFEKKIIELNEQYHSIALFMIDIDNFKNINDVYGHVVGDEVIIDASRKIQSMIHTPNLTCRFGGEEFLILLWDLDKDATKAIGESIIESIQQGMIHNNQKIDYTVSIGLLFNQQEVINPLELIHMADKLMYEAKNSGKNKMMVCCE
jgi:diguanylate cyclase (GGDEF)-like protein